jgi:hypothetical protein
LTNAAVRLFQLFSRGDLELKEELEIKARMKSELCWNNARIVLESEFEKSYTGAPSDFTQHKVKYITDGRIKKILSVNWRSFKKEWPIFDKLPHFAIRRLKV